MQRLTARTKLVSLLGLLVFLWSAAYAQITPSADSYTNTATSTTNYGAKPLLDVDGASQITYIQFNLASIPATASVSQATLKLYVNGVITAGSFNVDYINSAWSESTIDASNAPPLGTNIASNVNVTTAEKNQYILINVTSAVQAWLSGSETNNGIALVANGTFNATFDSKENTTTSHAPELDIAFAGGKGTITGVTTASGSGLTGGGTSGTLSLSLTNACASKQVLQWNGTAWACSNSGTGTITSVTAGTGLTGGGTSGAVTLNLNSTKVPLLAAANTFTGNQTVNGNLNATGTVSGSSFEIGNNLFGFGSVGNGNAFLGFAGNPTTTGTYNTASGVGALQSNTTGAENTAIGYTALQGNTAAFANTATGYGALQNNSGNFNNADGMMALYSNGTGYQNTATGVGALYYNTTGAYNTANGIKAGAPPDLSPGTGSGDTFLGAFATMSTGSLSNATAIGANALVSESNALVLGSINGVNGATANTNVGIGTTQPLSRLEVHGADPAVNGYLYPALQAVGFSPPSGSNQYTGVAIGASGGDGDPSVNSEGGDGIQAGGGSGGQSDGAGGIFYGGLGHTDGDGIIAYTGSGLAGILVGDVEVNGSLSKSGGSFKIDHPLDPANKYLYHSFVESPDMMNIYDGVATLDASGEAIIQMPEWFSVLNRDFRYQITCIGGFAPVYIAEKLSNNQFKIGGGKPAMEVSWQITGIRQDAWANAHRIPVEEEKEARLKGFYIHPELYGAPAEKQIEWARHPRTMKRMQERRQQMKEKHAQPTQSAALSHASAK
jgi:hypothetical protein